MKNNEFKYVEPADYFPKEIRKKHGLGEYAKDKSTVKKAKEETVSEESTASKASEE